MKDINKNCFVFLFCLLVLCGCFAQNINEGRVTIVNNSSNNITSGTIEVCGQTFPLGLIEVDESETITFIIKADSHYDILINFASENKLKKEIGYVTRGMDVNDILKVYDDSVVLEGERGVAGVTDE